MITIHEAGMVSFNGFLPDKYQPLLRAMHRKYKPHPRPLETTAEGPTGRNKGSIRVGSSVLVAEKENYASGRLTQGRIIRILTPRAYHPRGMKVLLDNGRVGRVQQILVY